MDPGDVWDVLLVVFLVMFVWYYVRETWISGHGGKTPPGPPYIPVLTPIWTLWIFLRDGIWACTAAYSAKYGDFVRVWLGTEQTFIVSSPSAAAHVLKSSNYRSRFGDPSGLAQIGMQRSGVIFNNDVRSWKSFRFFFVKALYKEVLDRAAGVSAIATRRQLANIRDMASSNPDGAVDVVTLMRRITLEIGNRLFLGVNIENDLEVVDTINGYFAAWEFFMIRPTALQLVQPSLYRKHKKAVKALQDVVGKLVDKKRACMEGNEAEEEFSIPKGEHDFAAALIQAQENGQLSACCVRQSVTEMLVAGPDTMSVNIYFILLHIAEHGLEDGILREIREVVGDRDPTREDLNKMAFLDHVINESMRTRPVVTFVMRRAEEEDHVDGYVIPKGSNVIVNLVAVHQDPRNFPQPEKFDPDHFKEKVPSTQFMPFGLGLRSCVGRTIAPVQMKVVIITLLRMYQLRPSRDHQSLDVSRNLSEHPTEPGYMFLYPRVETNS
ncbi:PREDICTED: aromatase-like [Branchiostoma belcheri]|uniref:aromatase n=1 Tax=Branchiostoma belcheri TaxID=7741 RepID=A0A6P4ZRU9_BRABE|nr:PREDICTED: aromatase-like [Branchiostoma belcheri]